MHAVLSTATVVGVLTAATLSTVTTDLLAASDAPEGFEFTEEIVEIGYDELAQTSPYSVGHVAAGSPAASDLRGGQDIWHAGEDATMLREVVVWPDEEYAEGYVDEVVGYAGEEELIEVEPPFDGARAFAGRDEANNVSVRMVVWRHGIIGAAVSHFHFGDDPGAETIREASTVFADGITATSGFVITLTPPDEEPTVVPDSTSPDATTTSSSGGGIPITTVLLWLAVIIGAIWLVAKIRRKLAGPSPEARGDQAPADTGEATAEASADAAGDTPPGDEPSDRSTDDIVAEARRRARHEVDEASDLDIEF